MNNASGPVPVTATFTVTDGDGDTATANIAFAVTDANAPTAAAGCGRGRRRRSARRQPGEHDRATSTPISATTLATPARRPSRACWAAASAATRRHVQPVCGLNGTTGAVGTETVTYSWDAATNTLTATGRRPARTALFKVQITDTATGAYTGDAARQRAAGDGSERRERAGSDHRLNYWITDADGSTARRHADHHLRRRCADGDERCVAERCGRRDGDGDAGLCCGRGRRVGHADQRHDAGIWRRRVYSQAIDIGAGRSR